MELLLKDRASIKKLERLKNIIKSLESVVVAFSGGVDSSLIAKVCYDALGEKVMAVTA
ncbi:MAG: ATP-dependent sacrificial sulfur transferase LarE, partial [Candidatus Brocadiales bacterium]